MNRPCAHRTLTRVLTSAALSLALALGPVSFAHASDLVDVPDAKLAACIRTKLTAAGLTTDFTAENLATLTRVSCANVNDLTGIEWLTGVTDLVVQVNDSVDLSRLARMPALRSLSMPDGGLTTLASLPTLPSVTTLNLQSNTLSDIGQLAGFTGVTKLSLQNNQISDLTPLRGMTALQYAALYENKISDLAGLEGASNLTSLLISHNQIRDLGPLAGATRLSELEAISNQIETLGDKGSLKSLTRVNLTWNRVGSIAALSGAPLTSAILSGNLISDISPLSGIAPKATVYLRDNRVRDFSPLPDDVNLDAYEQTPAGPTEAVVGVPFDFGVRDVDGTPLCLWQLPEGATCEDGRGTFTIPGKVQIGFLGSRFSVSWVQPVGPTGHLHATSAPSIYGSPIVSATLEASEATWSPTPDSVSYQWYADGQPLASTSRYLFLHASELGKRITACTTAQRDSFYDDQVCSTPTAPVTAWQPWPTGVILKAPKPIITGRAKVGRKLEVMTHAWDPGVSFHIRWQRNGKDIKGARGGTYRLTRADLHKRIRVKITGTRSGCTPVVRYSNTIRPTR